MNNRIDLLRQESLLAKPSFSAERAVIVTETYRELEGKVSTPVLRAMVFKRLCELKTIWIGPWELIVGERGPRPKAVSTYPELSCHSMQDLEILDSRPMTRYKVEYSESILYRDIVIPFWRGRTIRDYSFAGASEEWKSMYDAGLFTEFMEQRAPGHTSLDGTIFRTGLLDQKTKIENAIANLDYEHDPHAGKKKDELEAMSITCDGVIIFAKRHADLAEAMASDEKDPERALELRLIADICRRVPANSPKNFWEALQSYWFIHLGIITELNGWDAMSPGRLDIHLNPFYEKDILDDILDKNSAKELLACFWIKFNNTPAPPKVGITAAESATYNDFTNINIGGLDRDGNDASNAVSYLLLETLDELRLLQPQANLQVSSRTPDKLLEAACNIIRKGYGYPSLFNADEVIMAQTGMGKILEDAREGGISGCVETGCFGKEAYILHGYLNLPKILEITLNDGIDPLSDKRISISTGHANGFKSYEELYSAFEAQLNHVIKTKIEFSNNLDKLYADKIPAPLLSVLISDCIENGKDYHDGGARYNTDYLQLCGLATTVDSLAVLKEFVFDYEKDNYHIPIDDLMMALSQDWKNSEKLRQFIINHASKFGNDNDRADEIAIRIFESSANTVESYSSPRGGIWRINILSTTCHVYFGKKTGATPDGRFAGAPESDGASPSQGADRHGITAVFKSLARLEHKRTGGVLLNQRFLPSAVSGAEGNHRISALVRTFFKMGGHHVQFNVVDSKTLRDAQKHPEAYRDLLVRVAGYSDFFVDLDFYHQEEIISRTGQE